MIISLLDFELLDYTDNHMFVFVQYFVDTKVKIFIFILSHLFLKRFLLPQMIVGERKKLINEYFASFFRLFRRVATIVLNSQPPLWGFTFRCEESCLDELVSSVLCWTPCTVFSVGAHRNGWFLFPEALGKCHQPNCEEIM
uniref:Uncharacterized protein n=1 Tax=Molossus molossus TaxID=27622 RepID=A0A7J8CYW4_MOLMO|nr:hypothetical protein HJG59_009429 [Molossus molossus]